MFAPFRGFLFTPAYAAAVALVVIQVGIGVIFKISQKGGDYGFSISSSLTISELLKLFLATALFFRECSHRLQPDEVYQSIPGDVDDNVSQSSKAEKGEAMPRGSSANSRRLSMKQFVSFCLSEMSFKTRLGFMQLTLLYALINNTVFIMFKLVDPGTIQLIKSGSTIITAIMALIFLGQPITRIQWSAIVLQVFGVIVTQYDPTSNRTSYPLATYALLVFQTTLSAVAGIYNQSLCKAEKASLHANNMALYASGAAFNFIIHGCMRHLKGEREPKFFDGYDSIGAVLVILSNVFIGLSITAVYKYADAIVKCFATAMATGILLYIAPIFFHVDVHLRVIPGTMLVFLATYMYSANTQKSNSQSRDEQTSSDSRDKNPPSKLAGEASQLLIFGTGSLITLGIIVYLNTSLA